jgi:hypothetical protein
MAEERDMVSKIKTLPQRAKEGALEKEDRETVADSPLAVSPMRPHSSSAPPRSMATSHMTRSTRSCPEEVNSKQIEDVLAMFSEMGIVAIPILSGLHHHYVRI